MEQARGPRNLSGFLRSQTSRPGGASVASFWTLRVPRPAAELLTEDDLHSPLADKWKSLLLFVATCLSTFWAGATNWMPFAFLDDRQVAALWSKPIGDKGWSICWP